MTEKDKVSGKVARVTEWKTHKGYFLNLKDDSNDYYGFGKCGADIDSTVTLQVSEGTGNFSDKIRVDKFVKKVDLNTVRKETADKSMEILDKSIKSGENTYFERQNLIIRQCCIKAAASIVGNIFQGDPKIRMGIVSDDVENLAERFYAYIMETDQKLPEPPEEP